MLRFVANLIGSLLLALAVVFAVADIARSLAQDAVTLTPLAQAMALIGLPVGPGSGASAAAADILALVSAWPAAVVLASLAFVFLLIGRPSGRSSGRYAR